MDGQGDRHEMSTVAHSMKAIVLLKLLVGLSNRRLVSLKGLAVRWLLGPRASNVGVGDRMSAIIRP